MANKYVMDVNVTGNAEQKLDGISKGLSKVASQAQELSEASHKAGKGLEEASHANHAMGLHAIGEEINKVGEKFKHFSESIIEHSKEIVHGFIEVASEFEDIRSTMDFAFGDKSQDIYNKTFEEAKHLSLTFKQASDTVAKLGAQGINAFGNLSEGIVKFQSKTGGMIGALDVIQDTMQGLGLSMAEMPRMLRGVEHAAIGNFKMFQSIMPHKTIEEMKKAMATAPDLQTKFEKMMGVLGKIYGGATAMKTNNYSYQIQQITDKMELLKASIAGGDSLKVLTGGLRAFQEALARIVEDKDVLEALAGAFRMIYQVLAAGMKAFAGLIDWTRELVKQMPWLPKVAMGLTMLATGFAVLSSAAITAIAAVAGLVAGFAAIGWEAVLAAIVAMGPALLAAGAALGAFVVLGKGVIDTFKRDWSGVGDTLTKINVAFKALTELIGSYNGTTAEMSVDTAEALKKNGMEDFVLGVLSAWNKLHHMWEAFMDTVDDLSDEIGPTLLPLLDEMSEALGEIADAFGITDAATKLSGSSVDDWTELGKEMGHIVAEIAKGLIWMGRVGVFAVRELVKGFEYAKPVLLFVWDMIKKIVSGIESFYAPVAKLLSLGDGDKGGPKKHSRMWHENAEIPGSGDLLAKRRPGGAYRDEQGNFDPFQDPEAKELLDKGYSKQEVMKMFTADGRWTGDDMKRMARGRDKSARVKGGEDFDKLYGMAQDSSSSVLDVYNRNPNSNITEDQGAGAARQRAAVEAANKASDARVNAEIRDKIAELIKVTKEKNMSVEMDGKTVARAGKEQNMSVNGEF